MEPLLKPPDLTAAEWGLVLQLLERERALLPVEVRHTATRKMREDLKFRLEMIEELVKKVSPAVPQLDDSTWAAAANC